MSNRPTILTIDDEVQIRRLLDMTLSSDGYRIISASTAEEGIRRGSTDRPDLIILDLGLPDADGLSVLKRIREWSTVPIVILSVRSEESDIIECLNAGADDYLVKPFRSGELSARVRAALRHRTTTEMEKSFQVRDLVIDFTARVVKKSDSVVHLTATEYNLLALFSRNPGRVLTHQFILQNVWGPSYVEQTEYTRVYVAQLRKKIEDDPSNPNILLTESGIGYRLALE